MDNVLMQQAFVQSAMGMAMIDPACNWVYANDTFCHMLGYEREQLLMIPYQDISFKADLYEEQYFQQQLLTKSSPMSHVLKRFYHKDGHIILGSMMFSLIVDKGQHYFLLHIVNFRTEMADAPLANATDITSSVDLITRMGASRSIIDCSPAMKEYLHYQPNDLYEHDFDELLHQDDIQTFKRAFRHVLHNGGTDKNRYRIREKQGTYTWFEMTLTRSQTENIKEVIAHCHDVSRWVKLENEQHRSKQVLELSYKYMTNILDGITDGFITVDHHTRFTYLNREAEHFFLKQRKKLIGKNLWQSFPDLVGTEFESQYHKALSEKKATRSEMFYKPLNRWIVFRIYPTKEATLIYFLNITTKKQIEHELRESEERYRNLVELSPETILVHRNQKIEYINPAGVNLLAANSESDIIGRSIWDFFPKEDYLSLYYKLQENLNGSQLYNCHHFVCVNGEKKEVEFTSRRINYKGQEAVQALLRDASERRKYEELMSKSEKLSIVGQLAAGVAHEVRNPLTTVKGFIQLFHSSKTYSDQYTSIILEELDRVEAIIYEFLTLAKPNQETKFKQVNMKTLIEQVVTLLETQALIRDHQIFTEFETVPLIECESSQIKQVLINVIQNGLEAMKERGAISIKLKSIKNNLFQIEISDTGCGIPPHRLNHLGEPFYSNKEKGTGLGLMVSFKIIEHHNGNLSFSSKVGEGTTVHITLPIEQERHSIPETVDAIHLK